MVRRTDYGGNCGPAKPPRTHRSTALREAPSSSALALLAVAVFVCCAPDVPRAMLHLGAFTARRPALDRLLLGFRVRGSGLWLDLVWLAFAHAHSKSKARARRTVVDRQT